MPYNSGHRSATAFAYALGVLQKMNLRPIGALILVLSILTGCGKQKENPLDANPLEGIHSMRGEFNLDDTSFSYSYYLYGWNGATRKSSPIFVGPIIEDYRYALTYDSDAIFYVYDRLKKETREIPNESIVLSDRDFWILNEKPKDRWDGAEELKEHLQQSMKIGRIG